MLKILRTNSNNKDFQRLVLELNKKLLNENINVDVEIQKKYNKLNIINDIDTVIIAYNDNIAVGCGCFKIYNYESVEIKRMFVLPEKRKLGISSLILKELELWIKELKYKEVLVETGKNMIAPINLYKKYGYKIIDNYGEYVNVDNSLCMKKIIN
jgi:putative acetyltransferase